MCPFYSLSQRRVQVCGFAHEELTTCESLKECQWTHLFAPEFERLVMRNDGVMGDAMSRDALGVRVCAVNPSHTKFQHSICKLV